MSWLWKALRALSWFKGLGGGLLGGVLKWANPVWGAVLTVVQGIVWLVKTVITGMFSFLQNPQETVAVLVISAVLFAFGIHFGIGWDAHLVKQARQALADVHEKMGSADERDAARAAAAVKARREAEEAMRAQLAAEVAAEAERAAMEVKRDPPSPPLAADPAPVAADPATEPAGLRKPANKVRRRKQESGMFGSFSADWNKTFGAYVGKID